MLFSLSKIQAQNFVNPDLDGVIIMGSQLPVGWQNVPDSDVVCLAFGAPGQDSPDLTDLMGPDSASGLLGNPYSGTTFVSGLYDVATFASHHEGIMQTVSGFSIGSSYKINFQQAVVKQIGAEDSSGLWLVYVDSTLIGATAPTYSNATVHSISFIWESRDAYFTATDTSHTIKFLPFDDDPNHSYGFAIRMGIDSINLAYCFSGNGLNDTIICVGDSIPLNVATPGATYLWQDNSTDSIFTVMQAGTYWVQVTTASCSITDTITIASRALPVFSLGNDTTLCEGDSILLAATTINSTYLWQNNTIDSVFQVNQSDTYFVEVTNSCGAISDTIKVTIDTLNVNLGVDTILCLGDVLTLNTVNTGATYLWQDSSIDSVFTVVQDGLFWAAVTRGNCIKTDTIAIVYDSIPVVNFGNDTILCEGETLALNATTLNSTYLWQDNSIDSTFQVSQSGSYAVTLINSCGTTTEAINITVDTINMNLGADMILCPDDTLVLNAATPNSTYTWQDGSIAAVFTVTQTGLFSVTITRGICIKSDAISVYYDAIPVINLGKDTTLCEGEELTLNISTPNSTYLWQDGSTNSSLVISLPNSYWVEINNSCGVGMDTIEVTYNNCSSVIEMPNVFTPNRDNKNDLFLPVKAEGIVSYQIVIYNRWGQELFHSKSLMQGWDGRTSAGNKVPNGSYFWVVNYINLDGIEEEIKGHLSLLRD